MANHAGQELPEGVGAGIGEDLPGRPLLLDPAQAQEDDLARDLALCAVDRPGDVRELGLLDETRAVAAGLDAEAIAAYLDRLGRASVFLRGNVSPGLVLDDLAVTWPRPRGVAA